MSTQNIYFFPRTLGGAWSIAAQYRTEPITRPTPGAVYGTPGIGSYGGMIAIVWTDTYVGPIVNNYIACVLDMPTGAKITPDMFVTQPGNANTFSHDVGPVPLIDYTALIETYWNAPKKAILTATCTGIVITDLGVARDFASPGDIQIVYNSSTLVLQAGQGNLITTDNLTQWKWNGDPSFPVRQVDDQVIPGGALVQQDVAGIVDALQEIGLQDYDISINHGQSIFSVRGRTLT